MKRPLGALALFLLAATSALGAQQGPDRFDHVKHAKLFPACATCHAGAVDSTAPLLPVPVTACAGCHDGKTERTVDWAPRAGPRPSNLKFEHQAHPKGAECLACHSDPGAPWMTVRAATSLCSALRALSRSWMLRRNSSLLR